MGHGAGTCGAMDEADHGFEVVSPVVAPGEAGEVALGMVGSELAVPVIALLMLPSVVFTHLNEATRAALGPEQ